MRGLEPLIIYYREMYFSHGFIELKAYQKMNETEHLVSNHMTTPIPTWSSLTSECRSSCFLQFGKPFP